MATVNCKAKQNKEVKMRGKPTLEWHKNDTPMYYCYGYKDSSTEELLNTCSKCKDCVIHAQEDFENFTKG